MVDVPTTPREVVEIPLIAGVLAETFILQGTVVFEVVAAAAVVNMELPEQALKFYSEVLHLTNYNNIQPDMLVLTWSNRALVLWTPTITANRPIMESCICKTSIQTL